MPSLFMAKALSFAPNFPGKLRIGDWCARVPGEHTRRLRHFHAQLDLNDRIQRRMFLKRCHEPETESLFRRLASGRHSFYDVGANVGYFSLLAASSAPGIHTEAFEPFPGNVSRLRRNLALNPSFDDRVTVHELCVGAEDKAQVAFDAPPEGECGWGRVAAIPGTGFTRTMRSLDSLVAGGLPAPDFIKIDVEGGELAVLQGAERVFSGGASMALCVEINESCLVAAGTSGQEIFAWLMKRGFRAYAYSKWHGWEAVAAPWPKYRYLNYFFLRGIELP